MRMKTIFSFVLLSSLACTGLQAQQAQALAGPAGIWVLAGTDLPEGNHFTIERVLETDDRVYARAGICSVSPAAVVAGLFLASHLIGPQLLELFLGAVTPIGLTFGQ
jgi:hypothetical protein